MQFGNLNTWNTVTGPVVCNLLSGFMTQTTSRTRGKPPHVFSSSPCGTSKIKPDFARKRPNRRMGPLTTEKLHKEQARFAVDAPQHSCLYCLDADQTPARSSGVVTNCKRPSPQLLLGCEGSPTYAPRKCFFWHLPHANLDSKIPKSSGPHGQPGASCRRPSVKGFGSKACLLKVLCRERGAVMGYAMRCTKFHSPSTSTCTATSKDKTPKSRNGHVVS